MKVEDVLSLKETLKSKHGTRESLYDEIEEACGGSFEDRTLDGSFRSTPPSALPDRLDSERDNPDIVVNLVWPIIEAKRSFIGQLPTVRVPKPPSGDIQSAEKLERVITGGVWQYSNMARRMSDIGFYCPVYGTAVGMVWPDIINQRPKILVRSPRGFYPVPKDDDGYDLKCAVFASKYSGDQAAAMYDKKSIGGSEDVEIIQYIDDKEITTITSDGVKLKSISHKLGFCPVVCIPNIGWPGSPFGESDIQRALALQKELNFTYSLQVSLLEHLLSQPIVLEGAENFPEGIPMGPRDVIEVTQGGRAYRVPPLSVPYDMFKIQQLLEEQINAVSDAPTSLRSEFQGSIVTGAGFNATLGPLQARLRIRLDTIYPAIERLNIMALKMYEVMFKGKHSVYGWQDKKPYSEEFDIKEFNGWYENDVFLDSGQYFDEQSRFVMMLQGIQNGIISKETAMRYFPLITDVPKEKEQINKEMQENVQMTMAAQAMAASPATTNPPMNEPGKTNYSLSEGFLGETGAAPMPGGAEINPQMPGAEMGAEQGTEQGAAQPEENKVMQQLVDGLRRIANIRGSVFLTGEMLDTAAMTDIQTNVDAVPGVVLQVTSPLDKQTILNGVKANIPFVHGNITFKVIEGEPDEAYVTVFIDGMPESGYEIQQPSGMELEEGPREAAPATPEDLNALSLFGGAGGQPTAGQQPVPGANPLGMQ